MDPLLTALLELLTAARDVLFALAQLIYPWLPLAAWLCFWLFAPDWVKLRDVLVHKGGWIGLVLIGVVWVLVWGAVAPPSGGVDDLYGLKLSNFIGKTVYVTALLCIMLLAGSVQLSGALAGCCDTLRDPVALLGIPPAPVQVHAHDDGHGGHGHAPAGHH